MLIVSLDSDVQSETTIEVVLYPKSLGHKEEAQAQPFLSFVVEVLGYPEYKRYKMHLR